jgi:uncharacterized Fe-S cluster protein YjdI
MKNMGSKNRLAARGISRWENLKMLCWQTTHRIVQNHNFADMMENMDPNERTYTNGEITVRWRPSACIHATTCYRELIEVFNPRSRPWVNMQGAPTERIIEIVKKCPTDALSYDWNEPGKVSDKPTGGMGAEDESARIKEMEGKPVEIRVMKNGPYVVEGDFRIIGSDGTEKRPMRMTSFCRCGASSSMPFCDGSHRIDNFTHSCD